MKSKLKIGNVVSFPEFTKERAYMIPIRKNSNLPKRFERWQDTVNIMLEGIETDDVVYMTIDQSEVKKGDNHRRNGLHIDGNYTASEGWDSTPGWITGNCKGGGIILAASEIGCKAYDGTFNGAIGDGGDCSSVDLSHTREVILQPNRVYIGNVTMLHKTVCASENQNRTFIRLTLPKSYIAA